MIIIIIIIYFIKIIFKEISNWHFIISCEHKILNNGRMESDLKNIFINGRAILAISICNTIFY